MGKAPGYSKARLNLMRRSTQGEALDQQEFEQRTGLSALKVMEHFRNCPNREHGSPLKVFAAEKHLKECKLAQEEFMLKPKR